MAHKSCKGTFFKESFLQSQKIVVKEENYLFQTTDDVNRTIDHAEAFTRKSSRRSLQYHSLLVERKCIICNKDRYSKGRIVPLQNVSLEKFGEYKAEQTLRKFANIHVREKNVVFVDGANNIVLLLNTTSLSQAYV